MTVKLERLGSLVHLARRQVEVHASREYREIGVRSFGRGIFHKPPVTGAEIGAKRVFAIAQGDLVVSNVFAWEGAVAIATEGDDGRIGSHRFMTWAPLSEQVDVRYLLHYLTSDVGVAQLRKASPGSAGRNKTLSIKAFQELRVPLPDVDRQRAIVLRLDELIDVERALEYARSTRAALVASHHRAVLASVPASQLVPLREVISEVRREIEIDENCTYEMLGVRSFGRGAFDAGKLNGDATAYRRLRVVRAGDVVYPKLMAWEGAFAVVPPEFDGRHVSPEFCTFEVSGDRVVSGYLGHLLRDREFLERFTVGSTGTNVRRRRLQPADFLEKPFPLPNLVDQQRIVDRLDAVSQLAVLDRRQQELMLALPQAARNEVFSNLV